MSAWRRSSKEVRLSRVRRRISAGSADNAPGSGDRGGGEESPSGAGTGTGTGIGVEVGPGLMFERMDSAKDFF